MRVGGTKKIKVDVRIIAATNKELSEEVLEKNFREDLYYRLRSINIFIPPLRERKSDIKLLYEYFIELYCKTNNIEYLGIEDEAFDFVLNYNWPGNARELKNFCESIIILNPGKKLTIQDIKKYLQTISPEISRSGDNKEQDLIFRALLELKSDIIDIKENLRDIRNLKSSISGLSDTDFIIPKKLIMTMTMDEIEKEVLIYLLDNNYWNVEKVADILKQTPRNIYRKIKTYNINRDDRWKEL
jgi:DNA-binding NtrC family response regulator